MRLEGEDAPAVRRRQAPVDNQEEPARNGTRNPLITGPSGTIRHHPAAPPKPPSGTIRQTPKIVALVTRCSHSVLASGNPAYKYTWCRRMVPTLERGRRRKALCYAPRLLNLPQRARQGKGERHPPHVMATSHGYESWLRVHTAPPRGNPRPYAPNRKSPPGSTPTGLLIGRALLACFAAPLLHY